MPRPGRLDQPRHVDLDNLAAVVLAGSLNRVKLYEGYQPGHKALLMFNGKPAIEYTLMALRSDPRIKHICIVGPKDKLDVTLRECDPERYEYEPPGKNIIGSLEHGLTHFEGVASVLIATEDMPLITGAAVTAFLDACEKTPVRYEQNLFISFVPKRAFTGAFAAARKTFNRFRGVSVVHGNLALVEPNLTKNVAFAAKMNSLYEGRKDWRTQLKAVGFRLSFAYVLGAFLVPILSLENMARLVSWRLGLGFNPVLVEHPEICVDIDEPKDYKFVKALLEPNPPQVA
jgi:molybdopterin-guanine dinucleotide biosynthesis protein A